MMVSDGVQFGSGKAIPRAEGKYVGERTSENKIHGDYSMHYNRRHRRNGHQFQNRYKSILCQEDAYLLELVRYIHLNPLRAELVADMKELGKKPV